MNENVSVESTAVAPARSGLSFRGLAEVFYNPVSFFKEIKDNPRILVPYVVLGICTLTFLFATADLIVQMQMNVMTEAAAQSGRPMPPMSPEMLKGSTLIFGTLAMLVIPLIIAGLAYFWGSFVFGGTATFKQVLSVALYSEFLYSVGTLLLLPMIFAKQSMLVSYSLAAALPEADPASFLYVLLSKFSVFLIWELIVGGIGLAAVFNVVRGKGMRLSFLSIGLLSIIQVLWVGVSQLMK